MAFCQLRHLLLIEAGVLCAASEAVDLATVAIDLGFGSRDLRCQLIDLASQNVLLIVDFDNALLRDRSAIIFDNAVCNIGRDEVGAAEGLRGSAKAFADPCATMRKLSLAQILPGAIMLRIANVARPKYGARQDQPVRASLQSHENGRHLDIVGRGR